MKPLDAFLLLLFITPLFSQPALSRIRAFQDTVGLYEKYQVNFDLEKVYENPFDPEQIDIRATFTSPSGKKYRTFGFYNRSWFSWEVRFAANETGQWTYILNIKDKSGAVNSNPDTFYVKPSRHKGALRVAENKRYLKYDNGDSYYGVGFWYNGIAWRWGNNDPEKTLDELKGLGVNFISTILPPIETIATGVGRYDQQLCNSIDELLTWLEERDMVLSLNLWFHSFLSETVWPGFNRQWHTNPYQFVTPAREFYSNKKAWKYQEKLYRYMIARWAYSRALAIWFVVDEVNGTDGWAYGDSSGAAQWGKKVHDFFKENDPYQHLTTGTRSGGIREWWQEGYETFDLAAREIYEAQGFPILEDGKIDAGDEHPLRLSYNNYIGEIRKLWQGFEKPCIIGETGWDHTFYEMSMPGYHAQYHNALWGSLANGLSMTPFWWSYSSHLNDVIVTRQLTSIANFTATIPFAELQNPQPVKATISNGDAWAIKSDQLIFGWAVNPRSDVTGDSITVLGAAGEYILKFFHTWRGEFIKEEKVSSKNGQVTFQVPLLKIEDGHAGYIGQDVAFILKSLE